MPAIISDQFRISNADLFTKNVKSENDVYYSFIGQPNSSNVQANGVLNWGTGPLPVDGFKEENEIKETIISLKKITSKDVRRLVRKVNWISGTTYEMYRHDYSIYNLSPVTNSSNLYDSNYYVVNENLQVYICLNNGYSPLNKKGKSSQDQPTFIDIEPRSAGTSGDGYIWKYLYTIKPSEIIKFDTLEFIPVPDDWELNNPIKSNAVNGKIETILIEDGGTKYSSSSGLKTFTNIPILGDGTGGKATVIIDSSGVVSDVFVSDGGKDYTKGYIDFRPGANGIPSTLSNSGTIAKFTVIIPPKGGHGYDVYRELGAYRVLLYSRYTTDSSNPDTIVNNDFARVGIIKNPKVNGSDVENLKTSEVSALKSLKLTSNTSTIYDADSVITQTIGTGVTAIGFVASWDNVTGVLKYYQPVGLATSGVGFNIIEFSPNITSGGSLEIKNASSGSNLSISTSFGTIENPASSVVINNTTYQLGSNFIAGISSAEYNKKSGEIIYIDNRQAITRTLSQKEDIKIVLEF